MSRIGAHDLFELIDGALGLTELQMQAGERQAKHRALLRTLRQLGATQIELGEIVPALAFAIELDERVERNCVALLDLERGAVRLDRVVETAELPPFEAGDRVQEREPLRRLETVIERLAVELHALLVQALAHEDLVDSLEERLVVGLEVERTPVERERAHRLPDLVEELTRAARELR